jgi:predicted enzyme related to lactoylglutathione lyase
MPQALFKKVATVFYPVRNVERAIKFYRDKLGLKITGRPLDKWVELRIGGSPLALDGYWDKSSGAVVILQVEDIDATYASMKKKGVKFLGTIQKHEWGKNASFLDSEGNILQIFELPAASRNSSKNPSDRILAKIKS